MALPALLVVLALLLWGLSAATGQLRCVDAARAAARGLARGESVEASRALARAVAPERAQIRISAGKEVVRVDVTATVLPVGLPLGRLAGIDVRGSAVARREVP